MWESYIWYKDELKGEYFDTFEKIELYCKSKSMDKNTQEELLTELMDVFLTAQNQGKSVDQIVGSNLKSFCKNFCSGIGFRNQLKGIAESVENFSRMVLILCISDLFIMIDKTSFFEIQSDAMPYLLGFLLGGILSSFLAAVFKTLMFRFKKINMSLYKISFFIGIVALVGISVWVTEKIHIIMYDWVLILITGIYLVCYYCIKKIFFKDFNKQKKVRYSDKIIEKLPNALHKKMEKKNKRLIKKGKEPMTDVEYTHLLQKQHRFDKWICYGTWGCMLVIYVGAGVVVGIGNEPMDTFIFLIVLAIAFIPGGLLLRFSNRITMWQKNTFDQCARQELDLFCYMEQQKLDVNRED